MLFNRNIRNIFNEVVNEKKRSKLTVEKMREELIRNLNKKGIRTSIVQINMDSDNLMIRLHIDDNNAAFRSRIQWGS
ncbi:MAG TPA: hypothetical protein PK733_13125 [Clostridiales bacterium]|nr:hypothetical protein [Clostridiales bacterium]